MSVPNPFVPTAAASSAATTANSFFSPGTPLMARSSAGRGAALAGSNTLSAPSRPSRTSASGIPARSASNAGERRAERNRPACSSHSRRTPPGPGPGPAARAPSRAAANDMPSRGSSTRSTATISSVPAADTPVTAAAVLATAAAAPTMAPMTPPPPRACDEGSTSAAVHARQCARPSTAARQRASDRSASAAALAGDLAEVEDAPTPDASASASAPNTAGAYSKSTRVSCPGTYPSGTGSPGRIPTDPGSRSPSASVAAMGTRRMTAACSPPPPTPASASPESAPAPLTSFAWMTVRGCVAVGTASP